MLKTGAILFWTDKKRLFNWNMDNFKSSFLSRGQLGSKSNNRFFLSVLKMLQCCKYFFGNLIFALTARTLSGNRLKHLVILARFFKIGLVRDWVIRAQLCVKEERRMWMWWKSERKKSVRNGSRSIRRWKCGVSWEVTWAGEGWGWGVVKENCAIVEWSKCYSLIICCSFKFFGCIKCHRPVTNDSNFT